MVLNTLATDASNNFSAEKIFIHAEKKEGKSKKNLNVNS